MRDRRPDRAGYAQGPACRAEVPADRPEWWPQDAVWPPTGPHGNLIWARFGRYVVRALIIALVLLVGLGVVGAFLASLLLGSGASALVVAMVVVGAVIAVSLRLVSRAAAPIGGLVDAAGRVADGDFTARARVGGAGPLRSATTSFNRMAEQLEVSDEQRRRLVADVGHELRTPLAVIRGEMEAMVDGVRPMSVDTVEDLLADILVMERLLEDLRSLSMAEAGRLVLHRESVDLPVLLEDVVEDLAPQATAAQVSLELEPASAHAEVHLSADPIRIRGIVTNLVVNAIRATPAGGTITIAVEGPDPGDPVPQVAITVSDTGQGIPPEDISRVFDRFHKGADSGGTGLGLTISRQYARAHGGDLTVTSTPAAGATFTLTVPIGEDVAHNGS